MLHKTAVVAFHIPDLGLKFKAPFDAVDENHSDFASLLALLEFIDQNQKYFSNHGYQIYGNNQHVVNFVNGQVPVPAEYLPLMNKAGAYRNKYRFSLEWVPAQSNDGFETLFD